MWKTTSSMDSQHVENHKLHGQTFVIAANLDYKGGVEQQGDLGKAQGKLQTGMEN